MPYITKTDRELYDDLIDRIATLVKHVNPAASPTRNGHMNYIVSKLIREVYGPKRLPELGLGAQGTWRYTDINDVMGMLASAKDEFYAKVARPYEDRKEHQNGIVYD